MEFTNLKNFMDDLTDWIIPGNSIVVYKDNKKVFEYSSGYADIENKIPMSGDKLLNIYSCSKLATVVAGLQLLERGSILLSDPLYEYIPEYRHMIVKNDDGDIVDAKKPITLQHLFTMTAGFSYDLNLPSYKKSAIITNGKMKTIEVIKCLAEEPLNFQPGEKWEYSVCHDVLAAVIELVSGQRFSDYVQNNIFFPLDIEAYYHNDAVKNRMAEQYHYNINEKNIVTLQSEKHTRKGVLENIGKKVEHILGEEYDSGGAGITTTVSDYAKFVAALSNNGIGLNGNKILSSGSITLLNTNHLTEKQRKYFSWPHLAGYGYGLGVRTLVDKTHGSVGILKEFGWGGAAGATALCDTEINLAYFYSHHMLNPQEEYYQPRLRNIVYSCL